MNQTIRIENNGHITLPKAVCEALHTHEGDLLAWQIDDNNSVTLRRVTPSVDSYTAAVSATLTEWDSEEDDEAYRDL